MATIPINKCPLCFSTEQESRFNDFDGNHFVECSECGLYFQNPRAKTEYEDNYWAEAIDPDGTKRFLTEEREIAIKNKHAMDIEYVNQKEPGRILDAGAGLGTFLSAINQDWDKYATELSEYCVDYMKTNYPRINVRSELIEEASFEDDYFDIIYCHHVIEHAEYPHSAVENISRMLKPGGVFIIACPNISSFVAKRFGGNYRLLGSGHITMWGKKTLSRLLEKYGLIIFDEKYPFFKTDYFTPSNLFRLLNTSKISPPFYGNLMTLYTKKNSR